MSIFLFSSVLCVDGNCLLVLNPLWSISYHCLCPELRHFNYIFWKCVLCHQSSGSCLHASCWRCRWWSLPGTTTSSTPGERTSWGLWPKTDTLATCLVSSRVSHLPFQVWKSPSSFCAVAVKFSTDFRDVLKVEQLRRNLHFSNKTWTSVTAPICTSLCELIWRKWAHTHVS